MAEAAEKRRKAARFSAAVFLARGVPCNHIAHMQQGDVVSLFCRHFLPLAACVLLAACSTHPGQKLEDNRVPIAGTIAAIGLASDSLLKPELLMGALAAWVIYDPAAPNWTIRAVALDEEHVRFELQQRALVTGGEGEARVVFLRNARRFAREGGFAGFRITRYEEGVESTRPFAHRYCEAEIELARSPDDPDHTLIRP